MLLQDAVEGMHVLLLPCYFFPLWQYPSLFILIASQSLLILAIVKETKLENRRVGKKPVRNEGHYPTSSYY